MDTRRLGLTALAVCLAIVGCGDPDPATAPVTPNAYAPSLPGVTVEKLTHRLVNQGFELKENRAVTRINWQCVQKKSTNVSLAVTIDGTSPERIECVQAMYLYFDKSNHEAAARSFLTQVARSIFTGTKGREVVLWVRESVGKTVTREFDGISVELIKSGNFLNLQVRWRPGPWQYQHQ